MLWILYAIAVFIAPGPAIGAGIGFWLLGIPGAFIGAFIGWMISN